MKDKKQEMPNYLPMINNGGLILFVAAFALIAYNYFAEKREK